MTTTINASTSSGLVTTPDNSGALAFQYNGVTTPTFCAVLSSNQNVTAATYTKAQLNTKLWDTAGYYDNVTNYRFTPLVAGYYQVSFGICFNSTSANPTSTASKLYKNGSVYAGGWQAPSANTSDSTSFSLIVPMNGTTDYLELYGYANGGSGTLQFQGNGSALNDTSYFQAVLLRSL
jgi:hypothetical protein